MSNFKKIRYSDNGTVISLHTDDKILNNLNELSIVTKVSPTRLKNIFEFYDCIEIDDFYIIPTGHTEIEEIVNMINQYSEDSLVQLQKLSEHLSEIEGKNCSLEYGRGKDLPITITLDLLKLKVTSSETSNLIELFSDDSNAKVVIEKNLIQDVLNTGYSLVIATQDFLIEVYFVQKILN